MRNITLYLFTILMLQSCAPQFKIQTNKAENFNEKIEKVYVLIRLNKRMPANQTEALKSSLEEELTLRNIPNEIEILNSLSLGNEYSLTKEKKKENTVMVIKQTVPLNKFDVKLFTPTQRDPIWRANLEMTYASVSHKKMMSKFSDSIIQKLTEDGLL